MQEPRLGAAQPSAAGEKVQKLARRASEAQPPCPDPTSLRRPPGLLPPGTRAPMDGSTGLCFRGREQGGEKGTGSVRTNRRQTHTSSISMQAGKTTWRHLTGHPGTQGTFLQNPSDHGPLTTSHTPTLPGGPLCLGSLSPPWPLMAEVSPRPSDGGEGPFLL